RGRGIRAGARVHRARRLPALRSAGRSALRADPALSPGHHGRGRAWHRLQCRCRCDPGMAAPVSLSRDLAARALALRADSLPREALNAAQVSLLDALAVMLAAAALEPATRPFWQHARAGGDGPAPLLAGGTAQASAAALANGALAHALDFEDTHDATGLHPNAVVIP